MLSASIYGVAAVSLVLLQTTVKKMTDWSFGVATESVANIWLSSEAENKIDQLIGHRR